MSSRGRQKGPSVFFVSGVLGMVAIALALPGCSRSTSEPVGSSLGLKSSSFVGDTIPQEYSSCGGQEGTSPERSWSAPPERTQSFALIAFDKDSPFGLKFTHWVLYDIPPEKRELPDDVPKQAQLPDGFRRGQMISIELARLDPVLLTGVHHYVFTLYALDTKLGLPPRASKKQVQKAVKGTS